jgi:hypothetical protein
MLLKSLMFLGFSLMMVLPLAAQEDEDLPITDIINYDDQVSETLTARAFWDWWLVQVNVGDELVIDMFAQDTLEPLVGILDPGGTLVARSEDGTAGGRVTLEYTAGEAGEYTIVATRTGNENGTSTGPYNLRLRRANAPAIRENPYQQVTFRCREDEVTNVATLEFAEDADQATFYVISVYGYDGFEPVIRIHLTTMDLEDCSRDSEGVGGNVYAIPGEEAVTLDGATLSAAQLTITGAGEAGTVALTIGSANGSTGRYVAFIDGFMIGEDDVDTLTIGQGPLAASEPLLVYMVAGQTERLDPTIQVIDPINDDSLVCDDAGRRGCEGVPSPLGLAVKVVSSISDYVADRFDAGIVLPPSPPQLRTLALSSFSEITTGRYALVLIGELPER